MGKIEGNYKKVQCTWLGENKRFQKGLTEEGSQCKENKRQIANRRSGRIPKNLSQSGKGWSGGVIYHPKLEVLKFWLGMN